MRILVCTKLDLHGAHFANRLLPALAGHEIVGLWLADKNRPAEDRVPELAQLRFLERLLPIDLLFPLIDALPFDQADRAPDATFATLGRRHATPVEVITALDAATRARLAALAPDLVIVARFSHLFDAASIAIPRHGILNVHPGRLPGYAGLHAPLRAVTDGAGAFGCSVHWITPGIDDGPLLNVIDQPIDLAGNLLDQTAALYPLAIPTLLAAIEACAAGHRPAGTPQDLRLRRYHSMPDAAPFAALARLGMKLWHPDALAAWLGRYLPPGVALPPLPGALR